jgi:NADPH-dependent 2,4-dienoyl-CoA reductase/sulfur reductase-like enzyme
MEQCHQGEARMHFVIIGGDAAGMSAASRAKRNQPAMDVTVLEQTSDVSYSACNMPYNIADPQRRMDDLVVRSAETFRQKQGINLLANSCVTAIDTTGKTLSVDRGGRSETVAYDRLLIATGAMPIVSDLPGFELPGVMALKSLEQGRAIKDYLAARPVQDVLIIGMGYIALEMCEALRQLGYGVQMIKPNKQLLPWMDRPLAQMVRQTLDSNGVTLRLGESVQRLEAVNGRICASTENHRIEADMVLTAIGVKPCSQLAQSAGLELGAQGAIAVDRQMRTSDPAIYAAGDCADAYHVVTGNRAWIPLALRANRAGWAVADHLSGKNVELPGIAGTAVFKVFDLQVARTGLTLAEATDAGFNPQSVTIKTNSRSGMYPGGSPIQVHLVADSGSGRLLGAQMVGRESVAHRINAAAVALHAKMTVDQFAQCDLAYAPPFGGVWDPLLIAANQLLKKL